MEFSSLANITHVAAAVAGGIILLRVLLSQTSLLYILRRLWLWAEERTRVYQSFNIPRYDKSLLENPLYRKAATYLAALPATEDSDHTNLVSSGVRSNDFSTRMATGQTVHDSFLGSRLSWTFSVSGEALVLRLRRQDRCRVLRPYLQHVEKAAEEIQVLRKEFRLYMTDGKRWRSASLIQPATFDTLALKPEIKLQVQSDLESFLKGRHYYARLGRVWKRSYLLYGSSGTGKSCFAVAMAQFLRYDIYNLDLSLVANAGDLRTLLFGTTPRSVILVENLQRHGGGVATLLDIMDCVFSCCAEERVMVLSVSAEKEALDLAVLRSGRLDVHIHFPLCDFAAFKSMASSYLGVNDHRLYARVEEGFLRGGRLSPAEVGEIMIANRGSPSRALKILIGALKRSVSVGAWENKLTVQSCQLGEKNGATSVAGWIRVEEEATVRELKSYSFERFRDGDLRGRRGCQWWPTVLTSSKIISVGLDKCC